MYYRLAMGWDYPKRLYSMYVDVTVFGRFACQWRHQPEAEDPA